ncbi:MAG: DUF2510 domain-containing protein [Actinobacteria bacterium]|nr:DUF2510 domain-containing protein [Actinomycetota bacterium]MSW76692.1 DUF2510 domain-containing protein [Actinomycetota bacterium]MSX92205.1 DUF2510 domain-containing protein [Actinomycetota bacterium]MSZ82139.1 DUF2510 domain-containing protein [Actinomycetota bacterium]MTB16978.1 DUF2510 domain-containing protein [Actinomycetota bacterium]
MWMCTRSFCPPELSTCPVTPDRASRSTGPVRRATLRHMQEFTTISASSFDPAALATTLTEKSAEGWAIVSIVPTGGDITAFLSRSTGQSAAAAVTAVEATPAPAAQPAPVAAEPTGWAVAPEPAPAAAPMAPIVDPSPAVSYQPAPAAQPAPAYQPVAAASPAVPAGWYADPAGRFELRYWDGGTWTEHVSRAGQQFTDPPVA